jgi:hypothetical protein
MLLLDFMLTSAAILCAGEKFHVSCTIEHGIWVIVAVHLPLVT